MSVLRNFSAQLLYPKSQTLLCIFCMLLVEHILRRIPWFELYYELRCTTPPPNFGISLWVRNNGINIGIGYTIGRSREYVVVHVLSVTLGIAAVQDTLIGSKLVPKMLWLVYFKIKRAFRSLRVLKSNQTEFYTALPFYKQLRWFVFYDRSYYIC